MGLYDNYPDTTWAGDPDAPWNKVEEEPEEEDFLAGYDDSWADMSDVERLIVVQALFNAIAGECKTNNPGNMRGAVDAYFKNLWEQTGAKSFDLKLFGRKVGTFSIVTTKGTPQSERTEIAPIDQAAFLKWAAEHDFMVPDMEAIKDHFALTGEVPDGCEAVKVITPEVEGGEFKNTRLVVEADKVSDEMGERMLAATRHMMLGE